MESEVIYDGREYRGLGVVRAYLLWLSRFPLWSDFYYVNMENEDVRPDTDIRRGRR